MADKLNWDQRGGGGNLEEKLTGCALNQRSSSERRGGASDTRPILGGPAVSGLGADG